MKATIAFDCDGTLVGNAIWMEDDAPNPDVVMLLLMISRLFDADVVVWSAGGCDYADMWVRRFGLKPYITKTYCKIGPCAQCGVSVDGLRPDIAIDDEVDFTLGAVNLILKPIRNNPTVSAS